MKNKQHPTFHFTVQIRKNKKKTPTEKNFPIQKVYTQEIVSRVSKTKVKSTRRRKAAYCCCHSDDFAHFFPIKNSLLTNLRTNTIKKSRKKVFIIAQSFYFTIENSKGFPKSQQHDIEISNHPTVFFILTIFFYLCTQDQKFLPPHPTKEILWSSF